MSGEDDVVGFKELLLLALKKAACGHKRIRAATLLYGPDSTSCIESKNMVRVRFLGFSIKFNQVKVRKGENQGFKPLLR